MLGRTIGFLPPLEDYIMLCSMKATSKGGDFQVSSTQVPLRPVSEVHNVIDFHLIGNQGQ